MAAQRLRRVQTPEARRQGFRVLPGGRRPITTQPRTTRPARPQIRYRREGKPRSAVGVKYAFMVQRVISVQTKKERVLIERISRETGERDWRIMTINEYKERFMKKDTHAKETNSRAKETKLQVLTTSASMLAKHPDAFLHMGHELTKSAVQLLAMVA